MAVAVVFDATVVIGSLVRGSGASGKTAVFAPFSYPVFYPVQLRQEIEGRLMEASEKSGLPLEELRHYLDMLLGVMNPVEEVDKRIVEEARRYAVDPLDALYVATALHLRSRAGFRIVYLVTWSKKDYRVYDLALRRVKVLNPYEFYMNYLRAGPEHQCIECRAESLDDALAAALLHTHEKIYEVTGSGDGFVEIEAICHRIRVERDRPGVYRACIRRIDTHECREIEDWLGRLSQLLSLSECLASDTASARSICSRG